MGLCLSQKERDRLLVMDQLESGQVTQSQAAKLCGPPSRQVRRIVRWYEQHRDAGLAGLVRGLRGRPSDRRTARTVHEKALGPIENGYGPRANPRLKIPGERGRNLGEPADDSSLDAGDEALGGSPELGQAPAAA